MDEARQKTLLTLVELSRMDEDENDCWGGDRAISLLRSQSSAQELRELGVDDEIIHKLWPDE